MKKIIQPLIILIATIFSSYASAQSQLLDSLIKKSDIIAHITVLNISENGDMNLGATQISIEAEVKYAYKGDSKKSDVINMVVTSHVDSKKWDRMVKKKEYIVFLKTEYMTVMGPNGPTDDYTTTITLADRLMGIQPYFLELHNQLVGH